MNISLTSPGLDPQQQWLQATIKLRSELKFDTRTENGSTFVVIEDPARSKYFQVGVDEFEFIASFDGVRCTADVLAELHSAGHDAIDEQQAVTISQWLMQSNLILSDSMDPTKRLKTQVDAMSKQALIGKVNPISFKVNLFNPDRMLSAVQPWFGWMFSKMFLFVWITACVWALQIVYTQWPKLSQASLGILSGSRWISLLVFWLLLKIVHEFAHGIACKRYGGEVPQAGVLFLLFTPMASMDVTSMWRFTNRWQRIMVAAAGMYVELFCSFVALIVWANTEGTTADVAYQVFLMASVSTILFNANPLMRYDGYYILSDLVQVPNLYTKGTRWFGDRLKSLFLGTRKTPNLFSPQERRVVKAYGSLAFFWKLSISVGLIIAASVMFKGAGLILGVLGAAMWFGMPLMKQYRDHVSVASKNPVRPRRVLFSGVMTAIGLLVLFWVLKAPPTKSAPVVVQFAEETILRSAADGFVEEILIRSGDDVVAGQPLVRLRNESLKLEVDSLYAEIKATSIQQRIFRQENELALASVEDEKLVGLRKQLQEKQEQLEGLIVRCPLDGFVFERNLNQRLGSFVHRGDELMKVAKRDTKEIIVSVDQRDLESIQLGMDKPLKIALPGIRTFESNISRLDPRASNLPTHPSLCAKAGGPLPLKPGPRDGVDSENDLVLLSPRFDVLVSLDDTIGKDLQSGQRGRAFFSARTQSLGSYICLAASDWLRTKIDRAMLSAP